MDQQIINNNTLIAKFMDGIPFFTDSTLKKVSGFSLPHLGKDKNSVTGIGYKLVINLRYHKDWNWLMPVVDKINKIVDKNNYGYGIGIRYNQIEKAHKAVVKFIKWYNKERK